MTYMEPASQEVSGKFISFSLTNGDTLLCIGKHQQRLPTGGNLHAIRLETADQNGLMTACGTDENQLGAAGSAVKQYVAAHVKL